MKASMVAIDFSFAIPRSAVISPAFSYYRYLAAHLTYLLARLNIFPEMRTHTLRHHSEITVLCNILRSFDTFSNIIFKRDFVTNNTEIPFLGEFDIYLLGFTPSDGCFLNVHSFPSCNSFLLLFPFNVYLVNNNFCAILDTFML